MAQRKCELATLFTLLSIMSIFSKLYLLVNAQSNYNANPEQIKIILTLWPPNFLAYIAQEKGLFEKNGVNVQLLFDEDYFNAVERYDNDEADGITIVFSDAIIQNSNGIDTKVVYHIDSAQSGDAIISKLKNLTDLKGRKIGVEGINTFSHLFALTALEKAGLDESGVEFVNVAGINTSAALASKSGLSKYEIIHGFHSTKLMTLQDNLLTMANTTGNMSSLFTSGEYASNFFTQRGVMSDYANISAIVDPKFIKTISGEKKSPILGNGLK